MTADRGGVIDGVVAANVLASKLATVCIYLFKHFLKIILTENASYWLRKYTPQRLSQLNKKINDIHMESPKVCRPKVNIKMFTKKIMG